MKDSHSSDSAAREAVDEYLWPLTGEVQQIDWESLAEQLRIRGRLADIAAHVRELHLRPRLRRLGPRPALAMIAAVTESLIEGPAGGPAWDQRLKAPVPSGLRDEWNQLAQRLRELEYRTTPPRR